MFSEEELAEMDTITFSQYWACVIGSFAMSEFSIELVQKKANQAFNDGRHELSVEFIKLLNEFKKISDDNAKELNMMINEDSRRRNLNVKRTRAI